MSTTIPPLVCDTPPPIDELEDISGDEDISCGANGSHSEHFEDETPSPSPSNHQHHAHNSILLTDSFPVVEDISNELNEMISEFHDVESIEQIIDAVLVEKPISPPSDTVNEMIGQNKFDILESNRFSQNKGSFDSFEFMGISMDLTLNCDNKVSNQTVCINPQSSHSRTAEDSDFDEQRRRIEISNLVNDDTNTTATDNGGENVGITAVEMDLYKSSDYSLNERTIHADEQPACEIELNKALIKTVATVQSKKENCDEKTFDADFSQFSHFQTNRSVLSITTITPDTTESVRNCENITTSVHAKNITHVDSNEIFDNEDDDFGDFSSFYPPTIAASSSADITTDMTTAIDFGSLNNSSSSSSKQKSLELDSNVIFDSSSDEIMTRNIKQATIPTNLSMNHETNAYCKNSEYNLGEILSTLFPTNMSDIDPEDAFHKYVKSSSTNDQFQFMNELTVHLKNVENAKALKHQWAKSVAKAFLVKSLGIDSRNILYGEKWNSAAPKFAANLGMSPLEPMKLNATTSSDTRDKKSTSKTAADVPAAQFDWNSSGLINPLDALHAHTLLLDLEQLVVVANLDKKNLNSSSSSTSKEKDDDTECLENLVLKNQTTSTLKLSEIDSIDTVSQQSTNSSSLIQQNVLNHRFIINDGENRIKTNHSKFVNGMHSIIIDQSNKQQMVMGNSNRMIFDEYFRSLKGVHEERNEILLESTKQRNNECQTAQEPATNTASETPKIISTISSPIVPEIELNQSNKSNETNAVFDLNPNSNIESVQTSDSYNVPGSSGTMKETHIFTPNKSQLETDVELSVDSNPIDGKHSSEETERVVVIKENVVKKEYRDIEYDPERVISLDEFSDFQFVNSTTNIAKEEIALERGQSPLIGPGSNASIDDNSESNSSIVNIIPNCNGYEKTCALNMLHSLPIDQTIQIHKVHDAKNEKNHIENLKRLDESMFVNNTNLHADISVLSSADIKPITSKSCTDEDEITSNAPTMMLSNILKPQLVSAVKPVVKTSIKSSPNIEWPGPGIDTDQLMWLEQRFCTEPQVNGATFSENETNTVNNSSEKYSEDDEWSEFVSVDQPQTPITNILSKNLLKQQNDEDDWSEFVSSTVPMNTKRTASNTQAPNNVIDSANDLINSSWNCNEMSISMVANKASSLYNVSMNQRTSYTVPPHSEAPSMISTLPDLRFVAPKSLVHMPNSSFMKK